MKPVVYERLAPGLLRSRLDRPRERTTFVLKREVNDRGRTTRHRGGGPGRPIVRRDRPAERHVHVRVRVYEARYDELPARIHGLHPISGDVRADGDDLLVFHQYI